MSCEDELEARPSFSDRVGIRHPLIQVPIGSAATPELAAAVTTRCSSLSLRCPAGRTMRSAVGLARPGSVRSTLAGLVASPAGNERFPDVVVEIWNA